MTVSAGSSPAQMSAVIAALSPLRVSDVRCLDVIGQSSSVVDVDVTNWHSAAAVVCDAGLTYFDFLTAYVHGDELDVVLHVCSPAVVNGVMIRAHVAAGASLPTLTSIYPGSNWHERETAEMFGLTFAGHPNPEHLLLSNGFQGHPLLKSFALTPRVDHLWPGEVELADVNARPRARRKSLPPGVLAEWSIDEGESQVLS